jgi:hypothetical protein
VPVVGQGSEEPFGREILENLDSESTLGRTKPDRCGPEANPTIDDLVSSGLMHRIGPLALEVVSD